MSVTKDTQLELHRMMMLIRLFEEALEEMFSRGLLHGTMHLSIGQEATAAGACLALDKKDLITSTHRGHGHCLGKGAEPYKMFAELLGREDGYCRGRGGSMHIADLSNGNLGANGIVAGSLTISVGAALSFQLQKKENIVCVVDGANDIKLFDVSGLGIAYRAQDLVKDLATTTLEEKDLSKILDIINKHFKLELETTV